MARRHGSVGTYNVGCRCDECRTESTRYRTVYRNLRAARLREDPSLAPHGSAGTYNNWGCRCDPCREACSADRRERRGNG